MHIRYSQWDPAFQTAKTMEQLVSLFLRLVNQAGGDANEALRWMKVVGDRYNLFEGDITFEDFVNELIEQGIIKEKKSAKREPGPRGKGKGRRDGESGNDGAEYELTERGENWLRRDAFEEIFSALKRDSPGGSHSTPYAADRGGEAQPETRPYLWGDSFQDVNFINSVKNGIVRSGIDSFELNEDDLEVHQRDLFVSCATVLAIDISHSMVLYGEDRITPARTLALGLTEFIQREFPKDSIDVILFGDEAFPVPLKELPYINCGPFHTNTKAALELGQSILRTKKQANKQIILITDGKPSAIHEGGEIYKNPFGLDPKIVSQTINEAVACRRHNITITTFMITSDNYLKKFVDELTRANKGKAYYTSLDNLGSFVFEDFVRNKKKRF